MKSILQGLKNLWYWLPIIWSDRQWDHWFFVKVLEHKLKAMDKFFMGDGPKGLNIRNRRAKEIRYCRILCTRIIKDDYLTNALRHHEQWWGVSEVLFCGNRVDEVAVPNLVGREREQEKQIRGRLYRRGDRQENEEYKELFRLLNKYVRGWWD